MTEKIGNINPFGLRMPKNIRNWVELESKKKERSMNWFILKALKEKKEREFAEA